MHNHRLDDLPPSPFYRQLPALLDPLAPPPGVTPIDMSLGDPRHELPGFVRGILASNAALLGRYSPTAGTREWKEAVSGYLVRRYGLPEGMIDPGRNVTHVSGTREGLFMLPLSVIPERRAGGRPIVMLPNPFYPSYAGAAMAAGARPVYVAATKENDFLPDYLVEDQETLDRTAMIYMCSPSNPQGAMADSAYFRKLITFARERDAVLVVDECYADIYDRTPPTGALEVCKDMGGDLSNVVVFHSLSKRSNLPGLRSGFIAGDGEIVERFARLREYGAVAPPLPSCAVAAACWTDDDHVAVNRTRYSGKIDIAETVLGGRFGFYRPPGGFFLWLDVGDGEAAAAKLWEHAAVRLVPGKYLAREDADGRNPGHSFVRVALVADEQTTRDGLERIVRTL